MAYWQVPADVLEDPDELSVWAREALAVALKAKSKR
jgi:TfoX/Sxy family transcriptional regulator of competence genes